MPISMSCACGQAVAIPAELAGKQARCPKCGRLIQIPAMGIMENAPVSYPIQPFSRKMIWPWVFAGLGLLLISAGVTILWNTNRHEDKPEAEPETPVVHAPEGPPVRKEKPSLLPKKPGDHPKELATPLPSPPQPKAPLPALPPEPPPSLEIVEVEPKAPQVGKSLTIRLQGSDARGKPAAIQYRTESGEDWKPVPEGVLRLDKVSGRELSLDFRAVTAGGKSSPVLARTWKVQPIAPVKPVIAAGPIRLEWKLKKGDTFFQELRVVQKPSFNVQGLPFTSSLQYTVVSRFTVEKETADGLVVQQKVEGARLLQADALTQGLLAPAVLKLPGTVFTIHLNSDMELTKFTGATDKAQLGMANLLGGQGLQLASLLDHDGWKEMAQVTFFQPNRALKPGARWTRKLTHNWGPLGRWSGQVLYAYAGSQKSLHKIDYVMKLAYQAPGKGGGLPFQLMGAAFQHQEAGGAFVFDAARGRVAEAQERFHVRGRLNIGLFGQNTAVELDEDQLFFMRILDQMP